MQLFFRSLLSGVLVLALSGCGTALRQLTEPYEADVSVQETDGSVYVSVKPKRTWFGWQEALGILGAFFIGSTADIASRPANLTYSEIQKRLDIFTTFSLSLALGDYILGRVYPAKHTPKDVKFEISARGMESYLKQVELKMSNNGLYEGALFLGDNNELSQLSLEIRDQNQIGLTRVNLNDNLSKLNSYIVKHQTALQQSPKTPQKSPTVARSLALNQDVDDPLPSLADLDESRVAIVIGIESYSQLPGVQYARRDAESVQRYLTQVLGVPNENIIKLTDSGATKTAIQTAVEYRLQKRIVKGKSEAFFYFAGHGTPDESTNSTYLVPFDGDPNYPTSFYPTSDLYQALGKLGAKSVTVLLDACFTGQAARVGNAVALMPGARPVHIRTIAPNVPPGVAIFAAAGPNQTSMSYAEKQHGLFTYFFLKALRENRPSKLSLGGLQKYLEREVTRQAAKQDREQTPILINGQNSSRTLVN